LKQEKNQKLKSNITIERNIDDKGIKKDLKKNLSKETIGKKGEKRNQLKNEKGEDATL
jgi:hypothetical protein